MNFKITTKEQVTEDAKIADGLMFQEGITEPGAYVCAIKNASLKKAGSGAVAVEIIATTEDNKQCKISLWVQKKDGGTTYTDKNGNEHNLQGISLIRGSLMPCLGISSLDPMTITTPKGTEMVYKQLIGQKIGMFINIKISSAKGKKYKNQELVTFFRAKDKLCGSEIIDKKTTPERYDLIVKGLKVIEDEQPIVVEEKSDFFDTGAQNIKDDSFELLVGDNTKNSDNPMEGINSNDAEDIWA